MIFWVGCRLYICKYVCECLVGGVGFWQACHRLLVYLLTYIQCRLAVLIGYYQRRVQTCLLAFHSKTRLGCSTRMVTEGWARVCAERTEEGCVWWASLLAMPWASFHCGPMMCDNVCCCCHRRMRWGCSARTTRLRCVNWRTSSSLCRKNRRRTHIDSWRRRKTSSRPRE